MRTLIVGAGPAGAALALLLARNGLEVELVERETDLERVFRGEALMPTGLDALYQMGLRDSVLALPWASLAYWEVYLDTVHIMHIEEPSRELGDQSLRVVQQSALLELLIAEARQHSSFSLRSGVSVRGLLEEGGRVRGVRASTPQGEIEIEADLVIGADGRASTLRKRAGIELRLLPESYDVLWFKLAAPKEIEGTHPILIFASGADAAFTYVSWDGRWQVAWLLPKGGWREARKRDWLSECAALMPARWSEHLLGQREALEGPSLLDVIVGRCPTWHRPGLLLLGDAAHPMSPVRAQGINMALRDAIVGANHLVRAAREGAEIEPALAEIQREREREIVRAQKLQYRELRGQRWARQRPWLMAPLLKLAPRIANRGFVQRSWLRQQHELRFGVTKVRLEV